MKSVEIDFIVNDSKAALKLYEQIFEVEVVEATDICAGQNEAIFSIYGTSFHILDENPAYQLYAPREGDPRPMWFNVIVPDIEETYNKAISAGCLEVQPIKEIPKMGLSNAIFTDTFGYLWMLHQVDNESDTEEDE